MKHCSYPHPAEQEDSAEERIDYSELITTEEYSVKEGETEPASKSPGPMALIHFKVWESGRIDMKKLNQLLRSGISHALWDAVLEYKILPSPLCSKQEEDFEETNANMDTPEEEQKDEAEEEVEDRQEDKNSRLSLKRLSQEAVLAYGSVLGTAATSTAVPLIPQIVLEGRRGAEMASEALSLPLLLRPPLVDDFEAGRRGRLTAAYHATLWDWTRLGRSLGAPAYQEHAVQLYAKPNLSSLLEELLAVVQSILPDFDLRTFQKTYESATQSTAFLPRLEQPEVTAATFGGGQSSSDLEFIVVGRSLRLWKASVEMGTTADSWAELGHLRSKFSKQFQNFPPLLVSQFKPGAEGQQLVASAGRTFFNFEFIVLSP